MPCCGASKYHSWRFSQTHFSQMPKPQGHSTKPATGAVAPQATQLRQAMRDGAYSKAHAGETLRQTAAAYCARRVNLDPWLTHPGPSASCA